MRHKNKYVNQQDRKWRVEMFFTISEHPLTHLPEASLLPLWSCTSLCKDFSKLIIPYHFLPNPKVQDRHIHACFLSKSYKITLSRHYLLGLLCVPIPCHLAQLTFQIQLFQEAFWNFFFYKSIHFFSNYIKPNVCIPTMPLTSQSLM